MPEEQNDLAPVEPNYRCHKEVYAFKIRDISFGGDGSAMLFYETGDELSKWVDKAYVEKHKPHAGGYFVSYKDGYQSFSPAKAFEEGYTKI